MKLKKPIFWDYKHPNLLSYLLIPFTLPFILNNLLLSIKKKSYKNDRIKNICVGNIYIGGTAKTPLTIKIYQILKNLNFKVATIKKFYKNQIDEQKILRNKTKLYCSKKRKYAMYDAIKDDIDVAIFDDGLQDVSINYHLSFVCFNTTKWIGNGFLIPAGPLREKIESISKYDAIFLNGNNEDASNLKLLIRKYNPHIKIFESYYAPVDIDKFDNKEKYLIFSGIGNPESFKQTLLNNKLNIIKEVIFPDHYQYTKNDIESLKLEAKNLNAKIITTEKDYVKLDNENLNRINFLAIELIIKKENELINFIQSKI
jgi:tetraacyldisaccharide 4'-kinase